MITETSRQAFESIKDELGNRQSQVYSALKKIQPANNLMISKYLRLPINQVTPRIKELRDKKLVGVAFVGLDLNTGRNTIYWRCVK